MTSSTSSIHFNLISFSRGVLALDWCPHDADLLMSCGKVRRTSNSRYTKIGCWCLIYTSQLKTSSIWIPSEPRIEIRPFTPPLQWTSTPLSEFSTKNRNWCCWWHVCKICLMGLYKGLNQHESMKSEWKHLYLGVAGGVLVVRGDLI